MIANTLQRFRDRFIVRPGTRCWHWTGTRTQGYGRFQGGMAHRFSYERYVGPIQPGLQIDHLCRNSGCVNPEHLEAVTGAENNRRASLARLDPLVCKMGHSRSEHTYVAPDGRKSCRVCKRFSQRLFVRLHPIKLIGRARGERVGTAKVTAEIVTDIRIRAASGESGRSIARSVGLSDVSVSGIVRRKFWRHVP